MPTQYYRIMYDSMTHYGFTYKKGLNIDTVKFNPHGTCKSGGLYYTTFEYLLHFYDPTIKRTM